MFIMICRCFSYAKILNASSRSAFLQSFHYFFRTSRILVREAVLDIFGDMHKKVH